MSEMIRWTPKRILYEIHERGMTLEKLAQFNGRNPSSMRNVWTRTNSIDEKIIADFLDVTPEELWPDRYPKTTSRIYDSAKWGALESKKASASTDTRVAA